MGQKLKCPRCGESLPVYRNPVPTVDVVVYHPARGVILVERANEPLGYALPGGFVDYGESLETAAVREAKEETGLDVVLTSLVGVYSDPARDPRQHTVTAVFAATACDLAQLNAGDDAKEVRFHPLDRLPVPLVFDHALILADFAAGLHRHARNLASSTPPCEASR